MPKFKVKISYALWHHEEHEVEIRREDYDSDEEYQETLAEFHEVPNDYCHTGTRKSQDTGDVMNGTWSEEVEEVNVLDQIVEKLDTQQGPIIFHEYPVASPEVQKACWDLVLGDADDS